MKPHNHPGERDGNSDGEWWQWLIKGKRVLKVLREVKRDEGAEDAQVPVLCK